MDINNLSGQDLTGLNLKRFIMDSNHEPQIHIIKNTLELSPSCLYLGMKKNYMVSKFGKQKVTQLSRGNNNELPRPKGTR